MLSILFTSPRLFALIIFGVWLMFLTVTVNAACKGINCGCYPSEIQFQSPLLKADEDGSYPVSLEADNVEAQGEDLLVLEGDAQVTQGRRTVVADSLTYYRDSERVVAEGGIEMILENGHYLTGDFADVYVPTQIGTLKNAEFRLAQSLERTNGIDTVQIESRGKAEIVNLEGEGLISLKQASFTNCKEGSNAVRISARHLALDQNSGVGRARNATVRFYGVPILYAPYLTFPINDERKTGFLTPGIGSDDESGTIIDAPWYWNIARNQDATITPRYFSNRGLQIGAEYRRKTTRSETYIFGEFLPDDDIFGDDRDLLRVQHYQQITDDLGLQINYNDVSDTEYFDDFQENPRFFSATFVPRDLSLAYQHRYFQLRARANQFQVIDPDIPAALEPIERLPSVTINSFLPDGPGGLRFGLSGSFNNFASDVRLEGQRTALNGSIALPLKNIWGYLKPDLSLHHRTYNLSNVAEGAEDSPSFTVPIFSIDAGIYFEKNIKWFGEGALQTLEPRIFYAFAPDEDQSDVPLFDTSQVTLNNLSNIFRANRFFGEDRVGDTNQVTLGLTSAIIDNKTGDQRLKASFGQLFILDDLEQNLRGGVIESGPGDLLAELRTESRGGWTTYTFLQFDHEESRIRAARFAFTYSPRDDARKRISLGYYFAEQIPDNVVDQVNINVNWPLADRWQFFGSGRFSIEDSETLHTSLGLEYNSCCWKIRLTGQDRINNRNIEDKKTAIFLELELTSLGKVRSGF